MWAQEHTIYVYVHMLFMCICIYKYMHVFLYVVNHRKDTDQGCALQLKKMSLHSQRVVKKSENPFIHFEIFFWLFKLFQLSSFCGSFFSTSPCIHLKLLLPELGIQCSVDRKCQMLKLSLFKRHLCIFFCKTVHSIFALEKVQWLTV